MLKPVRNLGSSNPGPVSLPKILVERGYALKMEMARGGGGDDPLPAGSRLTADIGALLAHPSSKEVVDTRIWPVPGQGQAAQKGAVGPNGRPYFDGRYSPSGAFRKYPSGSGKPHYGIDLPAPVDEPVQAADDGAIFGHGFEKNLGNYVAVRHGDGRVGIYAHLGAYAPLPAGTKVVQGQKIGKVGVSGNAAGQGSHLHFELREDRGKKTLARMSKGAVSVDPAPWIRARTVAR